MHTVTSTALSTVTSTEHSTGTQLVLSLLRDFLFTIVADVFSIRLYRACSREDDDRDKDCGRSR